MLLWRAQFVGLYQSITCHTWIHYLFSWSLLLLLLRWWLPVLSGDETNVIIIYRHTDGHAWDQARDHHHSRYSIQNMWNETENTVLNYTTHVYRSLQYCRTDFEQLKTKNKYWYQFGCWKRWQRWISFGTRATENYKKKIYDWRERNNNRTTNKTYDQLVIG